MNALLTYDDGYIKVKIKLYGDKVLTNFCGLNSPLDDIECEPFTVISIDSLPVYKSRYHMWVHLDNCAYKIVGKQMIDYLGENRFEADED